MKNYFLLLLAVTIATFLQAQNVGIGTTTPNVNAALEIKSTGKGILMPRVSAVAKNGMTNVPKGMLLYDTTYSSFYFHDGNKWRPIADKNPDSILTDYSGSPAVTANMSGSSSTNALSGILYDNGGPAGNYANNSNDSYTVTNVSDDSTVYYKVIVEQMNLESPYDSLLIYNQDNFAERISISGTVTGTYYIPAPENLRFVFKSNGANNLSGFKIRWSRVVASPAIYEQPPLYGWYFSSQKLAVRGGVQSPPNWAADSLGRFSFAYGFNTKAKGDHSFSFGKNVHALGGHSFAFGENSYATGSSSIAIGFDLIASGPRAIALGQSTLANGAGSIALGNSTTASGSVSIAMGLFTDASGSQSTAMGYGSSSSGHASTAMGYYTTASGYYSTAIGRNSIASGDTSFAAGGMSIASGKTSTAMGDGTNASGISSTALGSSTTASGIYSTAMGAVTTASGAVSTTNGYNTISRGFGGTVVGIYNNPILLSAQTSSSSTTPLFIVGNGTSTAARSNALVVRQDGNVGLGTDVPDATLHIKHVGGGGIILENENDGNKWRIYSASGDNNLTFYNNAGTEIADIDDVTGAFNALSDGRYKKNIRSISSVLPLVMQLQAKEYHFNWQQPNEQAQLGFIAQEAYTLFPQLVSYDKEKNLYKMNYAGFSTIAIKAIQEQQTIITDLQKQMEAMQRQIDELKKNK